MSRSHTSEVNGSQTTRAVFPATAIKPKVLRIIGRLNVGGPAQQACNLHERLRSRFHTVLVTGQLDAGEADMAYLLESKDQVHFVGSMGRSINAISDFVGFLQILSIMRKQKPDIVHTHTAKAGALGRVAALVLRVPVRVHTYHGHVFSSYFGAIKTKAFLRIERMLNRTTTHVIAISDSQANELVNDYGVVSRDKVSVVKLGFDLDKFQRPVHLGGFRQRYGIPKSKFVVLWAGRLVPVKHIELFAQVVQLAAANPRIHFVVAGDGPERRKLESLTAGSSNITTTGWIRDMAEAWAESDLGLLTSRNEGTPVSLIEAMAAGKPVVATSVGGVVDLISPSSQADAASVEYIRGGNGFFTVAEPTTMLNCIEMILDDPTMASAMGESGRSFVNKNYGADRLVNEINHLYMELLGESTSSVGYSAPHSADTPLGRQLQ